MYEWTVMIYMAGDNNLDSNGVADLREIKRVGSTPEVAVIAQFDRSGRHRRTKRYHLRHYDTSPTLAKDVVDDLGETNTGEVKEFIRFLNWGVNDFEAKRYLVILWGHGSGALDDDIYYEDGRMLKLKGKRHGLFHPVSRDLPHLGFKLVEGKLVEKGTLGVDGALSMTLIAPDDEAKDFLDNVELKEALLAAGRKIDILGMDACLMSMVEVCYQVRESVGLTVASEAQEEVEGWPYERFLSRLVKQPAMGAKRLAKIIVDEFVNLYAELDNVTASLSACDISKSPQVVEAVDTMAGALLRHLEDEKVLDSIMLSRYRVWADEVIETVDLHDFCQLLRRSCDNGEIKQACAGVLETLEKSRFVMACKAVGDGVKHSHGLGIYFPQYEVSPLYARLDFVQDGVTRWGTFLQEYVKAAVRT